jgi:hypothetical protein
MCRRSAVNPNPGYSMTDKPQAVINAMDTSAYFNMTAKLMCKAALPAAQDAAMLGKMKTIGLAPCQTFDITKLDAATQTALKDTGKAGIARIEGNQENLGRKENGWNITVGLGVYGTDYLKRATVAAFGWPANLQDDAVYPYAFVDSTGAILTGTKKYTLTFAKVSTPPVNGFWSITMYLIDGGWWFVANALNKFTVSMRDDPKFNPDGSLTLYFQTESPGKDKEANWLPAPAGEFIPMMRMYWPKEESPSILNGTWAPPSIAKANY